MNLRGSEHRENAKAEQRRKVFESHELLSCSCTFLTCFLNCALACMSVGGFQISGIQTAVSCHVTAGN